MSSDIRDETADDGLTQEQDEASSDLPPWPSADPIIAAARDAVADTDSKGLAASLTALDAALASYDEGIAAFERWINEVPL